MTVKSFTLKKCTIALVFALSAVFCMETQAQFANLMMNKTRKSRAEKSNIPTTVKSDSMDIDLAKDKIILLGNVEVDDPEMNIKCQKMTIFWKISQRSSRRGMRENPGPMREAT